MAKKLFCLAFFLLLFFGQAFSAGVTVVIKNTTGLQRENETVELNASVVTRRLGTQFIVTRGNEQIPFQLTYESKLIFKVDVAPHSSCRVVIKKGTPAHFDAIVCGKLHPERLDDMAWENDRMAFRCYGPALQKTGERSFGNDMWMKNTPKLIVDYRYNLNNNNPFAAQIKQLRSEGKVKEVRLLQDSASYHIDHGNGMDNYTVGPTLGAGTPALIIGDSIVFPYCFTSYKILDNGPLRFTVSLTYDVTFKGRKMVETRIVSLDAGSQLNKTVVYFTSQSAVLPLIVGLKIHKGTKTYGSLGAKYLWGCENNAKDGFNYTGLVFKTAVDRVAKLDLPATEKFAISEGSAGHIYGELPLKPGARFVYYWGGGWSKYGFKTLKDWQDYLDGFSATLHHPLSVSVKAAK
jgi:hypothetical protein